MKKWKSVTIAMVGRLILLSGCSSGKTASANQQEGLQNAGNQNGRENQTQNAPADGRRGNIQTPDISGEVLTVNGNELEIKLFDPSFSGNAGGNRVPQETGETKKILIPEGTNITAIQRPNGPNGPNGRNNGSNPPMGTNNPRPTADGPRGGFNSPGVSITVKDIKSKDIVSIWYNETDKSKIERMTVRQNFNPTKTSNSQN